jgi:hypothetical protein
VPGNGLEGAQATTTTTLAPTSGGGAADDESRMIWMIIAALAAVGLLVALLTWRYWLLTRPNLEFDDDGDLAGPPPAGGRAGRDDVTGTAAKPAARRSRSAEPRGRGRRGDGRDPFWDEPAEPATGGATSPLTAPGAGAAPRAPVLDQGRLPRRGEAVPPADGRQGARRKGDGALPPGRGQAPDGRRRRGSDPGRAAPPPDRRRGRQEPGRAPGADAPGGPPPADRRAGGQGGTPRGRSSRPDTGWGQRGPRAAPGPDPGRPPGSAGRGDPDVDMWGNPRRR